MGEAFHKNRHTFMGCQYKNHAAVWTTSIEKIQYQKGWHFLAIPRKIDTGLPLLVVALSVSSSSSKRSDTNRMPCKIPWIGLTVVWELLLPFCPQALNRRTNAFYGLRWKINMVTSNVPHLRSLVSVSCIEIIDQAKILNSVFSSIKQTHDGSVVSVVRMEQLQTRSLEIPQL